MFPPEQDYGERDNPEFLTSEAADRRIADSLPLTRLESSHAGPDRGLHGRWSI